MVDRASSRDDPKDATQHQHKGDDVRCVHDALGGRFRTSNGPWRKSRSIVTLSIGRNVPRDDGARNIAIRRRQRLALEYATWHDPCQGCDEHDHDKQEHIRVRKLPFHVDVRIICASHDNLRKMVDQGLFRADLYYRIAGISITIPPLRERRADIPALVKAMLEKARTNNGSAARLSDEVIDILQNYDYPGNIRELRNILQKAVAISTDGLIMPEMLKLNNFDNIYVNPLADRRLLPRNSKSNTPSTNRSLTDVEATHIESLLHQHNGHRAKVAEDLCISERTLYRKLKQYNLQNVGKNIKGH